jgi:ElaB/YqjD/DUF883 family membrane-anchored ribosome-binding protein
MNQDITAEYNSLATATDNASSALHRAGEQAAAMAQRGTDAMHHGADMLHRGSDELQYRARNLTHESTAFIRREPAKSMLIAAATGAALLGLLLLFTRGRN